MKMDLDWIVRKHGADKNEWVLAILDSMKTVDSIIATVRKLATELRPEMLDAVGLSAAIEWHCKHFQRRTGIDCAVRFPRDFIPMSSEKRIAVFRIFQEVMTNIARHSEAKLVMVEFKQDGSNTVLTICDDGVGFVIDSPELTQSLGVLGMRERALLLGASFSIESSPAMGTTVVLRTPLEEAEGGDQEDHEDIDR